ncbi:TPA: dTMP kinase [Pseudomonas aeruginosa]|nr:hypothetical protein [Pseudomonas aeruginosa]HBO3332280.1 hypothetical protein [Pseudomonas aeruginosa]
MFVVIEGIDGTGKATQAALIKEYYESKGRVVDSYDFPAYESFVGRELGRLLSGGDELNASTLPGKIMAMLFSLDRMQFFEQIKSSLVKGNLVISNRYSLSNAAFQSIRCGHDISEWVYELEYSALKLPKPDLYVVLKGNVEMSNKNVEKKKKRVYTDGHDLYERDNTLLNDAQDMYCSLDTAGVPRVIVDCLNDEGLKAKSEISEEIIGFIDFYGASLSELLKRSKIATHVFEIVNYKRFEIGAIVSQVNDISEEQKQALAILQRRFSESELGKRIGIIGQYKMATVTEKISVYLLCLASAKKYIPNMLETPESVKSKAVRSFCHDLNCGADCIVPMDRYSREVFGE